MMDAPFYRFKCGNFECWILSDGGNQMPIHEVFRDTDTAEVQTALADSPFEIGETGFPRACLLVNTGEKLVLLDAGIGTRNGQSGELLNSLQQAGFIPEQIDIVVLTHAHNDHFGGLLNAAGDKTFSNARYMMRRDEREHYTTAQYTTIDPSWDAFTKQLYAGFINLEKHLELLDSEQIEIVPGIQFLDAPGHTKHHSCIWLESGDEKLLYISDALLHLLQWNNPHWSRNFEYDIEQAIVTRRMLMEKACSEHALIAMYHAPFPGLGRIERVDEKIIWHPLA